MAGFEHIAAFIPAAGLGTRLKPLTDNKPKALVRFLGRTMLENVIEKLFNLGIRKFVVNIHHFPELMRSEILRLTNRYDIDISDESDQLLDTGGGLVKAAKLLNGTYETIFVHNVDVYADVDYKSLFNSHKVKGREITLALSNRDTGRKLLFKDELLKGWMNFKTGEFIGVHDNDPTLYKAFSGMHLVDSKIIQEFAPKEEVFPLIPWYINLCENVKIAGWEHDPQKWFDLGTVERIQKAEAIIQNSK